ncbi:RNase H domain-containing protein [Durusdinium trenchii]|uniref:RNase H domain-containing protein n=1 Tax=Durusdinium trenchii TaxID=1381693 RepID=A0ABP0LMD6_9DINO
MPGSLDMIAAFHFVCWGVLSTTSLSGIFREVVLDQGRWDEQFQIAVSDMGIPQPTRLVLVAAQPPESNFKHMMAMSDDLFHSGFRFFLLNWPVKQTSSYVVVPCPEYCSFDYLTTFLGLGELCKDDICVLRCLVPRGPSTYTSGESITMPTGTYCRFEFYAPEEVACVPYVLPQGELQLLQRSVRRFRIDHGSSAFCREPTCGLPPPGNPVDTGELQVHWLGHDFQKLDDWRVVDSGIQVFDYPSCSLHLSDFVLPCQPRGGQILTLADKVIGREIQMPDFSPLHHSLSQQWVDAEIQWTPFIEQLSPDLQAEAAELLLDLPPHVDYLEIFTDGSFSTGTEDRLAGWSLLIFGHRGPERYIIGYDWGLVSVDPMDPTWTGAESSNAKSAEVAALIRAIEWLFAHPQRCTCKLRFDSQLAGYSGNGDYNINPSDRQLRLLRALVQAYQTSAANSSRLSWEHVKGHSGNLGNEMADIFAKNAFLGQQELRDQPRPDYAPFVFGYRFPIESFWLYYCNLAPGTPLLQNAMLHLPGVHIGGDAIDRLPENLVTPPDHKMKQKQLSVFAATYNVMTLGPRGGSLFVQYLREQAVAHGLDILFLQETRSRHDQLVISATHYRYTAAAKDGVGGVEIWLTRERRKTGHAAFDKATTQVLHAAAQCLLLKTTLQGVTLLLLTFHAPHSGRGRHDIELFWQSLTSLVRPYVQKFPNLIVGADANAHFATELDGHIGYAGLEHATDHGGDCFRRFLLDFDLFIPSTFEHIHRGSHQTWWSFSAHKGARCDYFAVPKSWSTSFFQTEVKTSLDEGKAGIDHLPLTMHCKILFCTSVRVRSKEGFDRRSLQEATKEQIQGVLRDVQIPAWHEGIDQHAMKLVRQIHDRLCQEFPPKKGPRKSYISEAAWQIRSMRLRLRREAIKQKHMVDCLSLSWALDCWKGTRVLDLRELFLQGLRLYKSIQQTRQQSAETTKTLKRKLRADRTESLEQLAKAEPQMSQREFAQALQALGDNLWTHMKSSLYVGESTLVSKKTALIRQQKLYFRNQIADGNSVLSSSDRLRLKKRACELSVLLDPVMPIWADDLALAFDSQSPTECLWRYCPEVGEFFPLQQNWLQLFDYVTASPMRWKRTIRKLQARAIAVQKLDVEWMLWHQDIRDRCEPAVNSRAKTRRKSLLRHPHMQAAGPRCQEPQGHVPAMTTEVLRLQAEWTAALRSEEVTTPLLERLRLVTTTTFLYLEEIHDAFDVWVAQQGESTTLSTLAIFGQFRRMAEAEWLLSGVDTAVAADETIHEFFQREAGLMHELHVPIPRAVRYSPKVFAHLFSGARRKGDFQQHVEALHAMAISVDIIFDLTWGNLLQPTTFDLFSRAMHERVLTGFLSGPPCETWSRARAANMEGPRVLRSRDRLQGCTFLTRRETEQVSIGNQLLGVTLRFFLIALITGALAILEHPACPDDDMSLPSIWYLEVIGCLLRFPGCEA